MRVLVTGGAGFIGHHLVSHLLDSGKEVSVLDDLSTGYMARLEPMIKDIRFVEGSVLDLETVTDLMTDVDVVLHEAAIPSVARSVDDPLGSHRANTDGTINVMLAAKANGVRRVVLAGSSSVYGPNASLPSTETDRTDPRSPYAVSKLSAEQYLHSLGHLHGVETVTLRYFNVFGPAQDPNSDYAAVIPKFVTTVLREEEPMVNGSLDISRDFTHITNVVHANMLALETEGVSGETFNIGCGASNSLGDLIKAIGRSLHKDISPRIGPSRPGDVMHSLANIGAAHRLLGYEPITPFDLGVASTVAWFGEMGAVTEGVIGTRVGGTAA